MLATAAAGGEHLAWMLALTVLVTAERLLLPGRRRLRAVSLGLAVCALAVAL
jgi:predicted metal-binding membrane protein